MNLFRKTFFLALAMTCMGPMTPGWPANMPQKIGFQGKLLDSLNNPRNGNYDMTFRIYDVETDGSPLWSEAQSGVSVVNGVFSAALGAVNPLTTGLFSGASAYLEVQVGDAPMAPRQLLLMAPYAFRAMLADDLAPGNTSYVQVSAALQAGAVFHVASGTVAGAFMATGPSSFTASGNLSYSLNTSSGIRLQAGTLKVEGSGGIDVLTTVRTATLSATSGLFLPPGAASIIDGVARWNSTNDLLSIGTGAGSKTMADTDSSQVLSNKTLDSTAGNSVDATKLRTRDLAADAPSDGMTLEWNAGGSQWVPAYASTITVATTLAYGAVATLSMANGTIYLSPFAISGTLSLSQIRLQVTTGRAGLTGDVGIYDTSGNLVASGGSGSVDYGTAQVWPVTVSGAPVTIQPGQYYAAITAVVGAQAPAIRTFTVSAAGLIKGVGTLAGGGAVLPSYLNLGAMSDGTSMPFLSFNQ